MAKIFTYDQLAELTANGLNVATTNEIITILQNEMKKIYGQDIDLSPASVDAQYLMMESLILNNIYTVLGRIYKNMNPNTATGKYLDILCQLTNIKRKPASQSKVEIYVKNVSGSTQTISSLEVQDKIGYTWNWYGTSLSVADGDIIPLTFTCSEYGPISAFGTGVDVTTVDWDSPTFSQENGSFILITGRAFKIYQEDDAILGNVEESDDALRTRQAMGGYNNSFTTLEGLKSVLYNLEYIEDVYIDSNVTEENPASSSDKYYHFDGTVTLPYHNVYIALRYKEGVDLTNKEPIIVNLILNRITPGVVTQNATGCSNGTAKQVLTEGANVYWKKCNPINTTIVLKYNCINGYDYDTTSDTTHNQNSDYTEQEKYIKELLTNYLSSVQIKSEVISTNLLQTLMNADLKQNGLISMIPQSEVTFGGVAVNSFNAGITYFKYTSFSFAYNHTTGVCTLTIS